MATLSLSGGIEGFSWGIYGLGNTFNADYYIRAGITRNYFQDGASSISNVVDSKNANSSTNSTGYQWINYSAGTYTFYGFAQAANGKYYQAGSATVTVESDEPVITIDHWSWSQSNGEASRSQTTSAYNAITNQGLLSDFSYKVWNDMVQKVNDILYEFGYDWDGTYLSYGRTKMSSSDKEMTSDRFNSLRYNIGIHYSTGLNVHDLDTGKPVMGWYFTRLTDCMNDWIDRGY